MKDSGSGYVKPWAGVEWQSDHTPTSIQYGDIYWSPGQPLAEKQHVFIHGNRLRERWQALHDAHFTLYEVGFGFGSNCLATANLWRRMRPRRSILHYVAFEEAPVHPEDIARVYRRLAPGAGVDHEQLQRHAATLLECYPLPSPGEHLLWLDGDICLRLVIGDVNDTLRDPAPGVDAWYLDGFSPRCNPGAWRDQLFETMARASRPGATLATYSVAGDVRRGLGAAGFTTSRAPGFGNKAEMLQGSATGAWRPAPSAGGKVAIIGAGLAGLHCARALARRGIGCTLFEARAAALGGASSVPRLAVSPRLASRPDKGSLFSLAAFQYAMREGDGTATGYCRLATSPRDHSRQRSIAALFPPDFCEWLTPAETAARTGFDSGLPGLWLAGGGWCSPASLLAGAGETGALRTATRIAQIESGQRGVRLTDAGGATFEFDKAIIAGGHAPFTQTKLLALAPLRGQSISARLSRTRLDHVVSGTISLVPGGNDRVFAGATFALQDSDDAIRPADTARLARQLAQMTGDRVSVTASFAGVRCTSRDRMPVAGKLPHWPALEEYHRAAPRTPFTDYDNRLLVCTGFGAHGATHAPLCAEHIARLAAGEPDAFSEGWRRLVDPARLSLLRRKS